MKQIASLLLVALPAIAQFTVDEQMRFCARTNAVGEVFKWRMSSPQFPAAGRKYPLIIFLHGSGECGVDNKRHIKLGLPKLLNSLRRLNREAIVMAPQCQRGNWWVRGLALRPDYSMAKEPTPSLAVLMELIEYVKKIKPVDVERVYITGLSLGGFGAWEAITRYPEVFAAAVPICGGGDPRQAAQLKRLPVWVFHGDQDKNVSVECSRRMVRAMRDAGCRNVLYTEYPGVKHNSWDKAYGDHEMVAWLLDQRRKKKRAWWKFWER